MKQVKVWFLPYDVPEYADTDGWQFRWFDNEQSAIDWLKTQVGLIEEARFMQSGAVVIRDGRFDPNA